MNFNAFTFIYEGFQNFTDLLAWAEYEASSATVDKYEKAFEDTADKSQYYRPAGLRRFSQPGLDFLKAVRVFDFKQVSLLPCDELIKKIPGADNRHVLAECTAYKAMAGDVPSETADHSDLRAQVSVAKPPGATVLVCPY